MPKGIYTGFQCKENNYSSFNPQKHQLDTMNYFLKSPYKGLLLYHKLGSGKTCTAIMIGDKMLRKQKVKKVFILTPGSLRQGWINEYCKICGYDNLLLEKYIFVTYNYSIGKNLPDFNDSLVIIDEVHNLINGVKNFSFHPTAIYDSLLKSNCKILALSGTVLYNYVYEFALIGNLLKPAKSPEEIQEFPEIRISSSTLNIHDFMKFFNTDKQGKLIPVNKTLLKRKLDGIISYYPGAGIEYVPEIFEQEIIKVRMTPKQEHNYWVAKMVEDSLKTPPNRKKTGSQKEFELLKRLYIMAKKNILTRLASNFFYGQVNKLTDLVDIPKEVKETKETKEKEEEIAKELEQKDADIAIGGTIIKKDIPVEYGGWVSKDKFSDGLLYNLYSTKFAALLINIIFHYRQKHVLFTFFKERAGVYLIKSILGMCGITSAIFSGDLNDDERRRILKKFNSPKNRYGDVIRILLVTEAGAEGISVLEARHMHILESSPRMSKTIQAIGRVARFKSHIELPPEERSIKIWKYWSTASPEPIKIKIKSKSKELNDEEKIIEDKTCIDEILYQRGMKTIYESNSFLDIIKESSVTPF
jgi:superfamily II DNA or RNA helicase